MHVTIKNALFFLLIVLLVAGCGKGNKHGTQSTLTGTIAKGTSNPVIEYIPATGNGLRPDVSFDYSYDGYTSQDGFTMVYENLGNSNLVDWPEPEAFYDEPSEPTLNQNFEYEYDPSSKHHAGESLPIRAHYLEKIDGYYVYTMLAGTTLHQQDNRETCRRYLRPTELPLAKELAMRFLRLRFFC